MATLLSCALIFDSPAMKVSTPCVDISNTTLSSAAALSTPSCIVTEAESLPRGMDTCQSTEDSFGGLGLEASEAVRERGWVREGRGGGGRRREGGGGEGQEERRESE